MRLSGQFTPGMTVWACVERGKFVPGIVERVGHTKLTVLAEGELLQVGPTFVTSRNPARHGQDNPMLCGGIKTGAARG